MVPYIILAVIFAASCICLYIYTPRIKLYFAQKALYKKDITECNELLVRLSQYRSKIFSVLEINKDTFYEAGDWSKVLEAKDALNKLQADNEKRRTEFEVAIAEEKVDFKKRLKKRETVAYENLDKALGERGGFDPFGLDKSTYELGIGLNIEIEKDNHDINLGYKSLGFEINLAILEDFELQQYYAKLFGLLKPEVTESEEVGEIAENLFSSATKLFSVSQPKQGYFESFYDSEHQIARFGVENASRLLKGLRFAKKANDLKTLLAA